MAAEAAREDIKFREYLIKLFTGYSNAQPCKVYIRINRISLDQCSRKMAVEVERLYGDVIKEAIFSRLKKKKKKKKKKVRKKKRRKKISFIIITIQ